MRRFAQLILVASLGLVLLAAAPLSAQAARARLLKVLKASPERVAPRCRYFGDCGGCQYQHIEYRAQLRLKHKQIADLFRRIGGFGSSTWTRWARRSSRLPRT